MSIHDAKPRYVLFSPDGQAVHRALTYSTCSADIDEVEQNGNIGEWGHSDFPDFEVETTISRVHVSDVNGGDWLLDHCRAVRCPKDFSPWDERTIETWPGAVIEACAKAEQAAWALHQLQKLRQALPSAYRDSTTNVVLDAVVGKRLQEELDAHEATIAAFRKGRTEISVLPEEDEEESGDAA